VLQAASALENPAKVPSRFGWKADFFLMPALCQAKQQLACPRPLADPARLGDKFCARRKNRA
jgi:hypothetical protein